MQHNIDSHNDYIAVNSLILMSLMSNSESLIHHEHHYWNHENVINMQMNFKCAVWVSWMTFMILRNILAFIKQIVCV